MVASYEERQKVIELKEHVVAKFTKENWLELGVLTGLSEAIQSHDRLLRGLYFGDDDYSGNALSFLLRMADNDSRYIGVIEEYLNDKFEIGGVNVSSKPQKGMRYYFTPTVFEAPSLPVDPLLISVMIPFSSPFETVFQHIKVQAENCGMQCLRAKDIWENSAVIQDIFQLIWRSYIVVCDFTGKNANVFYEAGIAHTLGKHVIPIAQHESDVPFDLRHHRYLPYLGNAEGLVQLQRELDSRIRFLLAQQQGARP